MVYPKAESLTFQLPGMAPNKFVSLGHSIKKLTLYKVFIQIQMKNKLFQNQIVI